MEVKLGPTEETDEAESVQDLEREIAQAEDRVADLQRRVQVAEVEAEAARSANQFDPAGVAPVVTTLVHGKRQIPFERTTATGVLIGLVGGGVAWLILSSLLKR